MKTLQLLLLSVFISLSLVAQKVPQFINYQAVVRDSDGLPLAKGLDIPFKVTFYDAQGNILTPAKTSIQTIKDFGVVSFGLDASGITDKSKIYSIEVEATGMGVIGNTVVSAVPFALYAEAAEVTDSVRNVNFSSVKEFKSGDRDSLFAIFSKLETIKTDLVNKADVLVLNNYIKSNNDSLVMIHQLLNAKLDTLVFQGHPSYVLTTDDINKLKSFALADTVFSDTTISQTQKNYWNSKIDSVSFKDIVSVGQITKANITNWNKKLDVEKDSLFKASVASNITAKDTTRWTKGDISDVIAGNGLIGGASNGSATLDINIGNGLSIVSDKVELGGTLTKNATIMTGANNLIVDSRNGGKFILLSGTQAAGKVLTSDAAGIATWQNIPAQGDISDVIAGKGLIGGASTGSATLDINIGNGLSIVSNKVELGGTLTKNATIMTGANNLIVDSRNGGKFILLSGTQAAGKVLTSDAAGIATWQNIPAQGDISDVIAGNGLIGGASNGSATLDINIGNGLSIVSDKVELGGTLTKNATLFTGTSNFTINATGGKFTFIDGNQAAGKVLTCNGSGGLATWQTPTQGTVTSIIAGAGLSGDVTSSDTMSVNAANGLSVVGDNVELGGPLTKTTTIGVSKNDSLIFDLINGSFITSDNGYQVFEVNNRRYINMGRSQNDRLSVLKINNTSIAGNTGDATISFKTSGTNLNYAIGIDEESKSFRIGNDSTLGIKDRLVIDENGFVGIGASTPYSILDLRANYIQSGLYEASKTTFSTNNSAGTASWPLGTITGYVAAGTGNTINGFPGGLVFATKPTGTISTPLVNRMVIDANGNVGIGHTNPKAKLVVDGGNNGTNPLIILDNNGGSNDVGINFLGASSTLKNFTVGVDADDKDAFKISMDDVLGENNFVIAQSGNIGIGTSSPSASFDINKDVGDGGAQIELDNTGVGKGDVAIRFRSQKDTDEDVTMGFDDDDENTFKISKGSKLGDDDVLSIKNNNIGVRNNDPMYPLHVGSSVLNKFSRATIFSEGDDHLKHKGDVELEISIWSDKGIAADQFVAKSDERIKKDISVSDASKDLNTLMKIEITDYHFKDSINKGDKAYKKVIAQQVDQVYPQAVTNNLVDIVPDVYAFAKAEKGWVSFDSNIQAGDVVSIYYGNLNGLFTVSEVSAKKFKTNIDFEGEVFVYGHQVNDFHTVDYEAISMLNVSATQEIYRHVQALEQEIKSLKQANENYENRIEKLEASLSSKEKQDEGVNDLLKQLQERLLVLEATKSVSEK